MNLVLILKFSILGRTYCFNLIMGYKIRTYTPSLEDVGSYLALYWVPTRADGKLGDPLVAISSHPVMAG